jgi:hypothetical protein
MMIKCKLCYRFPTFACFLFIVFYNSAIAQCSDLSATGDCDGDGVSNNLDPDDDNDGIYDLVECAPCGDIYTNAGFESNIIGMYPGNGDPLNWWISSDIQIDGWDSTTGEIELWTPTNTFGYTPSPAGGQFAELNANVAGTFYQSMCVPEQSVVHWSIWHRGRSGVDVMRVLIGQTLTTLVVQETCTTGTVWTQYSGTYNVPAGQTTLIIAFRAVSTATGNQSVGNFIDEVAVGLISSPTCDPDGDGFSNHVDLNSDGDLCDDVLEANLTDQNLDGILGNDPTITNISGIVIGTTVLNGYTGTTAAVTDGISSPQCLIILPTELCAMKQECSSEVPKLSWTMCSEENMKDFTISGSYDLLSWEQFASEEAIGKSTSPVTYSIMNGHINTFDYLRLQGFDIDNSEVFSELIHVNKSCLDGEEHSSMYNPESIFIHSDQSCSIYDVFGRLIHRSEPTQEEITIEDKLSNGSYFVLIEDANNLQKRLRLIISR